MKCIKLLSLILAILFFTACGNQGKVAKPLDSSSSVSSKKSSSNSYTFYRSQETSSDSVSSSSSASKSQEGPQVRETEEGVQLKHRLEVPMQVQRAWNTCAPTTVSMMLACRGIDISQEQLAEEMGTDANFGTHNANAIQVLNQHLFGYPAPTDGQAGYRLETVKSSSSNSIDMRLFKERLKKNIDAGYPLYYTFDNSKMYPGRSGEHNVIGIGYELNSDASDIIGVYYIDPSYTVQDPVYGGLKKVTPQELLAAMLTCQEPNYAW
ncbi:C39 family peptidase [Streptococcus gordonii]|uniref:C39 family peptidase n=1 Tax=Streptococcus gordonii TaxID=1302 RepID=UPI0020005D98|nr:C39 family peptidase [Streptococcus gordonii]